MFSTIISKADGSMYHGIILSKTDDYFEFAFRVNDKNRIWQCHYDYWVLVP